ncbi:TetR/AcrR family transcriptional regulator [Laceyella putida]|uniref:TetR/AcrR family transcriptional regulator n=1 Tax=Laceyella putida TaxID=110101 RepID=A0ABW2RKF8_9BACL
MTTTEEKILAATIELMAEKGYKAVTTKEIAKAASVSEMTLFRCFGSKQKILESAVDKYSISVPLERVFQENMRWDLEHDLLLFSREYQAFISANKKVFTVLIKESQQMPELKEKAIYQNPVQLKNLLINYFVKMQQLGKMMPTDPEIPALTVLQINFSGVMGMEPMISNVMEEEFVIESIRIIARGLMP